jgi:hypothetical protein
VPTVGKARLEVTTIEGSRGNALPRGDWRGRGCESFDPSGLSHGSASKCVDLLFAQRVRGGAIV